MGTAIFLVLFSGVGCSSRSASDSTSKTAFYGSKPSPEQVAAQRDKIIANQAQWAKSLQAQPPAPGSSAPTPSPN